MNNNNDDLADILTRMNYFSNSQNKQRPVKKRDTRKSKHPSFRIDNFMGSDADIHDSMSEQRGYSLRDSNNGHSNITTPGIQSEMNGYGKRNRRVVNFLQDSDNFVNEIAPNNNSGKLLIKKSHIGSNKRKLFDLILIDKNSILN